MEDQILITYCLGADVLKALGHQDHHNSRVSDAEVLTSAIVAALYFGGNFAKGCLLIKTPIYIPKMLSESRFNRRLHRLDELFLLLFYHLAGVAAQHPGGLCARQSADARL